MRILPKSKYHYTVINNNENIEGVIEITEVEYEGIKNHTHCFSEDLLSVIPFFHSHKTNYHQSLTIKNEINKRKRYLDTKWRWRKERNECEQKEIVLGLRKSTSEPEEDLIKERAKIVNEINNLEDSLNETL